MKAETFHLELITPCFCAGANQAVAEIRASSIRGQLRWWFRALGGNSADERSIFGGVAGTAHASSLIVRIVSIRPGPTWSPPPRLDINSDSYVYHFASISGTTRKGEKGPRWTQAGALGPGTTVQVQVLQRQRLASSLQTQLDLATKCFLQLGTIGLRATRGLGAFSCREVPFSESILSEIQRRSFFVEKRSLALPDAAAIAREIGSLVKGTRKNKGWTINDRVSTPSPFGTSSPRQTSAVYFRPVRPTPNATGCHLVVFEAPHDRVLDKVSDKPHVVGHTPSQLQKPNPTGRRR
jgi:hypothetical protein